MIVDKKHHTQASSVSTMHRACTVAKACAHAINQIAIKPLRIAANTAINAITTVGTIQVTALESCLALPLLWYGKDVMTHGSACGVTSLLRTALEGDLATQVTQNHWTNREWLDFFTPSYWDSLYKTVTTSPSNSSSLVNTLFVQPFQTGVCKDFKADMMIVTPCALIIITSLTARIGYVIIKNLGADIYAKYSSPQIVPAKTAPEPLPLMPHHDLLTDITRALQEKQIKLISQ